jgi:hypothetical protein
VPGLKNDNEYRDALALSSDAYRSPPPHSRAASYPARLFLASLVRLIKVDRDLRHLGSGRLHEE